MILLFLIRNSSHECLSAEGIFIVKLVVLLGAPGSGKGTQCSLLSSRLGFYHISTGALIRKEIQSGSELGLRVKALVEAGNLVDDVTITACLESVLQVLPKGVDVVLLDGFPRNTNQANLLANLASKLGVSVQVLSLEADKKELVGRFEHRYTCSQCGYVESLAASYDLTRYVCPQCHVVGTLGRRKDDEPQTVLHRLEVYERETRPLVEFYSKSLGIHRVDALMPPEQVYARVVSYLI